MGRILAIDYGTKRTGVAVTDSLQIAAGTLGTVSTSELFSFLMNYLNKESVEMIVIGEPKKLNNEEGDIEQHIRGFIRKLKSEKPELQIERMDERFSSIMASRAILESGAKKKDRQNKALTDAVSAVIILQSFLDSKYFLSKKQ